MLARRRIHIQAGKRPWIMALCGLPSWHAVVLAALLGRSSGRTTTHTTRTLPDYVRPVAGAGAGAGAGAVLGWAGAEG
ncbi:predicted protein [Pyrenophora tritici-repentis Pt-1C-BFP]|uniref:Uncharacterized protein n=1 Tax=Pyrenophora tritici-repentis (strain Pt-1C-BFP) TaxID=426418 RepID=B2VYV7_PYRTR|nr:uncharacterized protein PTRG_02597 [Pyrenophora tritici-repentis Pt-1C-BFP]EDU45120.1 predicted protein [Pyrenophora tritici-repentis Pt-1C-BFP]